MANEVVYYDSSDAITDTKTTDIFGVTKVDNNYNMLRIKNDTDKDVIVTFGNGANNYLAKSGENILQAFSCSAKVALSVASGSSTGNFFIQLSKG
jgi:hypothetical protein